MTLTPRRGAQVFFVYVAAQALAAFAVGMLAAMIFAAATPERGPGFGEALMRAIALPTIGGSIFLSGLTVWFLVRHWLRGEAGGLARVGVVRPQPLHVSYAVLAGIALGFVHAYGVIGLFPPPFAATQGPFVGAWREGGGARALLLVLTLVVAPVVEEFVFRGALFAGFTSRWPLVPAGAMVTALFVAMHLVDAGTYPASLISITLLGIGAFVARARSGSIFPPMALHAAYNMVAVVVVYPWLAR
jgi:membrane protease YdiL (CAAX protease family)